MCAIMQSMPSDDRRARITAEVAEEWMKDGKLHVPPDDTEDDDDAAFFAEVERRLAKES